MFPVHWYSVSLAFIFGAALTAQTISFLPPVDAITSPADRGANLCATCVAIADFNGDGKPDIAYGIRSPLPMDGVVLGNGDGTFRPGVTFSYQVDGSPFAADFNGDGKTDVLFYGSSNFLFLGNGDGTFASPIAVAQCSSTTSLSAVADFNRDGKADLMCGLTVYLGNGDGTFRAAGTIPEDRFVLTADFNNDGIPDVLTEVDGNLAVALGRGDGTFGAVLETAYSAVPVVPILAGDFNGDGKLDLVSTGDKGQYIDVLLGNGDGTFGTAVQTFNSVTSYSFSAVGDFNKDGKLDLVAGEAVLAGNGDGTFRFPVFFGTVNQPCGAAATPLVSFPCNYAYVSTAVADFNGDGLPDIAAGTVAQALSGATVADVSVLLNDSPGDGFGATGVSAATLTWPVGAGSLVSAFGVNLASETATASVNPAPTTLGGIRLHVRDRSHAGDTLAPLLYVSPTQINYLLTSTDPYAWVAIERVGSPYVPKGMAVPISFLAPGLFSVGADLAAASGLLITPFAEAFVPVTSCSGQTCTSVPIDLSSGDVYLSLYGTGLALASAAQSSCTVAGQTLPLTYAGPEIAIAGLDQANLLLPTSLAGTGATTVVCSFATAAQVLVGVTAYGQEFGVTNSVKLTIR
jgi:uncharacterized protein (TIGR03437 family)